MMRETEDIVQKSLDFLPLKSYANIREGNALRLDWASVVPVEKLSYIMGNPPFVGHQQTSATQKEEIFSIFGKKWKNAGRLDYVCCWFKKTSELIAGTPIRVALVATNSVCQGEQVAALWKPLFEQFKIRFDFAYRTFRWDSDASDKAHVHCVIIGFSSGVKTFLPSPLDGGINVAGKFVPPLGKTGMSSLPIIFTESGERVPAKNINPYLIDAPDVFVESRKKPICNVPEIRKGNQPTDGGNLIIEAKDYDEFIKAEPAAKKFIKKLLGAEEFINGKKRYCLWLANTTPAELRQMPSVLERIRKVREMRLASADASTRRKAETPHLFRETNNPDSFIIIPSVSSEKREYIPLGFETKETIPTNLVLIIPSATLYHFGVLMSFVHMAWMRAICGRLKSDYRYSASVVYNNFPWCEPTPEQRVKIEATAQAILDARERYPDCSLADLYDETTMPPDLRRAHRDNDRAVLAAYGFPKEITESQCVSLLMQRYNRGGETPARSPVGRQDCRPSTENFAS